MRTLLPIMFAVACLGAMIWAVSFGTLPPADFTFNNESEIKSVDPAIVTGQPEGRIIWALFEGLVSWDPETLEPMPGVAERWEVSDDKLTYTFHLRDTAQWSDGSPVTADDFVWSMRRFLHPATASEYSYEMWYAVGAEEFSTMKFSPGEAVEIELKDKPPEDRPFASGTILRGTLVETEEGDGEDASVHTVEIDGRRRRFQQDTERKDVEDCRFVLRDFDTVGIRSLDTHTLQFTLKHPVPYFINLLGFYPMSPVNRRCIETHGYPAWTKPKNIVSNGPFRLQFRRIRDRIRLVKSETYWDRDNVKCNVIDAMAIESYPTALNLYLTGQIDWSPVVPSEIIPELMKRPAGDFTPSPYLSNYYYLFNVEKPPLDDPRVRRALNMATDKQEVVDKVERAGQIPARSIVPLNITEYIDYTPGLCGEFNVAEAQRLLAEAGYPGGRGFPRIEILYNVSEAHQAIAELLQSQWKRNLGIDVGLANQEWSAYLGSRRQGEYFVARAGWIGDYLDPNTFLEMFVTGNPNNHSRFANAEFDRLVKAAQYEVDEAKRLQHFHDAEQILMDEMAIMPIYYYVTKSIVRPYVKGWHHNIQDVHPLKWISVDQEEKTRILRAEGRR